MSFDTPEANRTFAAKQSFPFRLLSDTDRSIALAYRACETAKDAFPRRVTYVIGADGRIEHAIHTESAGRQAEELLALLGGR